MDSQKTSPECIPRPRLNTFPYVLMDGDYNPTTPGHPKRDRVEHVIYESADMVSGKPSDADSINAHKASASIQTGKSSSPDHGEYDDIKALSCSQYSTIPTTKPSNGDNSSQVDKPFDDAVYAEPTYILAPQPEAIPSDGYEQMPNINS